MRLSDERYSRDSRRHNLALRLIAHEARTQTVCAWTGLSDDRVRSLYRSFCRSDSGDGRVRHRGPSPQQLSTLLRSPTMRCEAAVIAGLCRVTNVMSSKRIANARRELPSVSCGERLCFAFDVDRRLFPSGQMSIEQVILLVTALADGSEIELSQCTECHGVIIVDRLSLRRRICTHCKQDMQLPSALRTEWEVHDEDLAAAVSKGLQDPSTQAGYQQSLF